MQELCKAVLRMAAAGAHFQMMEEPRSRINAELHKSPKA
jgi:hypothetical protein